MNRKWMVVFKMFRFLRQVFISWCFTQRTLCSRLNRGPPTFLFWVSELRVFLENVRCDPAWHPSTFFHSHGFSGTLAGAGWNSEQNTPHRHTRSHLLHKYVLFVFEHMQTYKPVVCLWWICEKNYEIEELRHWCICNMWFPLPSITESASCVHCVCQ